MRKQKIEYGSDENVKLLQNVGRSKYILSLFSQNFLRLWVTLHWRNTQSSDSSYMAASIGCNWRLRNLHGFILCLRLTTSLREAIDTQRTADCEGTCRTPPPFRLTSNRRASLGLAPRRKLANARRRQVGDYFVCHLSRRLKQAADGFLRVLYCHTVVGFFGHKNSDQYFSVAVSHWGWHITVKFKTQMIKCNFSH